jgi:hypothetical protein
MLTWHEMWSVFHDESVPLHSPPEFAQRSVSDNGL